MFSKYDEETYESYVLEMYMAEDVAANGEEATSTRRKHFDVLPSMDKIEEAVQTVGCDTFEITHITEKVERYSLNNDKNY
ncbi:hypothetical protein [Paenibacillus sp. FSL H3-0333]|uniref:hypothetical protein n=1 Tax=Paenibacillus sp. FSL H3-0333 TaxID=2921373 RepID=UPI0030F57882